MYSNLPKLPELVVPEQIALRKKLENDLICQAMEEHYVLKDELRNAKELIIERAFSPIPSSFKHLTVLVSNLREILGNQELSIKITILPENDADPKKWLSDRDAIFNMGNQIASFDEDRTRLSLALPASIINREKLGEAMFYSGRAIWKSLNEQIPYDLLLKISSPVGYWQKLQIGRLIRWNEAMANCMGLYFCRDLNVARQALLRDELGLDASTIQCDWSIYSFYKNFEVIPESEILEQPFPVKKADPFYFYVIEQFAKTDVFRRASSIGGSEVWDSFCVNSLEARKHIHPELGEMPEEEQRFRQHLMILTQYLVAEADDVIRTEEITAIEKNTDPNELIYLENELGWKRGQNGNTEDVASWVVETGPEWQHRGRGFMGF